MPDTGALGITFSPANQQTHANGQPLTGFESLPQFIQMLSLHLPKVIGAQALAPEALLTSHGAAARPDIVSAVVQSVLQSLGMGALPALPGQSPSQLAALRGLGAAPVAAQGAPHEAGTLATAVSQAAHQPIPVPHITPIVGPTAAIFHSSPLPSPPGFSGPPTPPSVTPRVRVGVAGPVRFGRMPRRG